MSGHRHDECLTCSNRAFCASEGARYCNATVGHSNREALSTWIPAQRKLGARHTYGERPGAQQPAAPPRVDHACVERTAFERDVCAVLRETDYVGTRRRRERERGAVREREHDRLLQGGDLVVRASAARVDMKAQGRLAAKDAE